MLLILKSLIQPHGTFLPLQSGFLLLPRRSLTWGPSPIEVSGSGLLPCWSFPFICSCGSRCLRPALAEVVDTGLFQWMSSIFFLFKISFGGSLGGLSPDALFPRGTGTSCMQWPMGLQTHRPTASRKVTF